MTDIFKAEHIYSRDKSEKGATTGTSFPCSMHGCTGKRVTVRWADGKTTYPCSKGLLYDTDLKAWHIA